MADIPSPCMALHGDPLFLGLWAITSLNTWRIVVIVLIILLKGCLQHLTLSHDLFQEALFKDKTVGTWSRTGVVYLDQLACLCATSRCLDVSMYRC